MIYYQAVCTRHGWESSLFSTPGGAAKSAAAHRTNTAGPHSMVIREIFVPARAMTIRAEKKV